LALVTQYNPHGIFIALEELGYPLMSVAFLFLGLVFGGSARLERALRWLLVGGALVAFAAYIVLRLLYEMDLEYRFEVAVITINWTLLIVGGVLLSVWFRRHR
jgi:lipopolysaccharide export LptBFGC system permease protein LptF